LVTTYTIVLIIILSVVLYWCKCRVMMGQEKNKENLGLSACYEGFGRGWCVADKYLCQFLLCSTNKGIWNLLDTSNLHGLCSANFLCVSDVHWPDVSLSRNQCFFNQVNGFLFSVFHRAFFNSIIDKTPTHALFIQHYISLACWFH
jgi:phosphatidylserine synthase